MKTLIQVFFYYFVIGFGLIAGLYVSFLFLAYVTQRWLIHVDWFARVLGVL